MIISRALNGLMEKYQKHPSEVAVWIDYACVEQDDHEMQQLGIASLIAYAARSDVVLSPVQVEPEAMKSFSGATHPMDLHNYGERAWCRLEAYTYGCMAEILMKPVLFFGFGMVTEVVTVGCFFKQEKELPPRWDLKPLSAGSSAAAFDSIEEAAEKAAENSARTAVKARQSRMSLKLTTLTTVSKVSPEVDSKSSARNAAHSGAEFAATQLPSAGSLTVETDRDIIHELEQTVMYTYSHFAVLAECARIARFEKEWEEQKILQATDLAPVAHNFSLRGKQLRNEDMPMVCEHIALNVRKDKGGEGGNGSGDVRRSLLKSRSLAEQAPRYKSMIESHSYGGSSFKWLQHVQTLDLGRNLLDKDCLDQLMKSIVLPLPSLTTLLLDENPLLGQDVFLMVLPYLESTKLEVLSLSKCGINHKSAQDLNGLTRKYLLPNTLVKLDLRDNFMIDRSVKYIIKTTSQTNKRASRKHRLDIDIDGNKLITPAGWFELKNYQANEQQGGAFG
mmetsp:Transcript_87244/g.247759  ORF Transcript_87244/g.247759 Transcript_87244/m.247759 type:complete len:505 (-) Transcript_87244:335-1849(-)